MRERYRYSIYGAVADSEYVWCVYMFVSYYLMDFDGTLLSKSIYNHKNH